MLYRTFFVVATMLLGTNCMGAEAARKPASPPDGVEFTKDVVYGKVGDRELKLNLARPKGLAATAPCVVFIHGGGWAAGNKEDLNEVTQRMAGRGYVAATVGYRFAPDAVFPAQGRT